MCGRYLFSDEEAEDIREIIRDVEERVGPGSVKTGEIFPTDRVPILLGQEDRIAPALLKWGFPGYGSKGILINARAESVSEKPMFRQHLLTRRCVIPSSGFFEWGHRTDPEEMEQLQFGGIAFDSPPKQKKTGAGSKQKYLFRIPGEKVLYMAGLYQEHGGERKFVILTTGANASMSDVHDRMPLILRKGLLQDWIFHTEHAMELLKESPMLEKTAV